MPRTYSYTQAAKLLGCSYRLVSDLVKAKGIKTHAVSPGGFRKVIDDHAIKVLRDALKPVKQ